MLEFPDPSPTPKRPDLPGTVVLRETLDDVLDAAAADLLIQANNCVRAFGDFHLAVSVSEETEPLLRRVMYDLNLRDLPWKRTHLWITDERAADSDDEHSRFNQLRQLVVDQSDIPAEQTHSIPALDAEPDRRYEAALREHLAWREKGHDRLDYVLLGLREDGSIAGLYPGAAVAERGRLAAMSEFGENPHTGEASATGQSRRSVVTMTAEMLNAARLVAVMATGSLRRPVLTELSRRPPSTNAGASSSITTRQSGSEPYGIPARSLAPLAGELRWYVDHEAAPV